MKTQNRAFSLPMLVCMLLISKMGMMLHELEHDPLSEEEHYCAVCLSGTPLDNGPNEGAYLLVNTEWGYTSETPSASNVHHRPLYRYLSRAPPVNFFA